MWIKSSEDRLFNTDKVSSFEIVEELGKLRVHALGEELHYGFKEIFRGSQTQAHRYFENLQAILHAKDACLNEHSPLSEGS